MLGKIAISQARHILMLVITISLFLVVSLSLSGCGYNSLQRADEEVKSNWAEVLNQYQRRSDLIPNLVKTVRGYADHEEQVFTSVAEARASVRAMNVSAELLNDEDAFNRFMQAQSTISSALSRLIAVAENYPQLKADGAFRDLQAQLEGTENRITVARKRYIDSVRDYNVIVRSFPSNLTAGWFGFGVKPTFTVEDEATLARPPSVDFNS